MKNQTMVTCVFNTSIITNFAFVGNENFVNVWNATLAMKGMGVTQNKCCNCYNKLTKLN
jgi:hypothetical protein